MNRIDVDGGAKAWTWGVVGLLALAGLAVVAAGGVERAPYLVFGGGMLLLLAASAVFHSLALRPGRDGNTASASERAAWSQLGAGMASIMVLGGISLGSFAGGLAVYLFFFAYALIVACYPLFRRRFLEQHQRPRAVVEDERDLAIRASGDYLSKRLLELALVALAIFWALAPRAIGALGDALQIAALLLLPVLAANVAGEARVAWLHWRDRQ